MHPHRYALLASTASLAALTGILLVPAAASAQPAASASAELGTADAVTITGSFAQPSVNAGSTDKLSGTASYVSGGSSQPLANTSLTITSTESGAFDYPPVSTTVTTAANGSFSYVTPVIPLAVSSVGITVSSAATASLDAGQLSLTLPVNQEAVINSFSGRLTAYRVLRFSACGGIPEPLADSGLFGPLDFQYSASRRGPWKTLGPGNDVSGPCFENIEGGTYAGTFTAPLANAYYRAYAPAVPGQMSARTRPIHLWDYPTKITGFTVTPRRVSRDGKVTVSGRLWHLKGKWLPDVRRLIVIEFRYKGKTYTLKHRLTTNSSGRFHGVFAVPHTAAWLAMYSGGRNDFAVTSNAISIRVR